MRVLALSDTHNYGYPLEKLPAADVLIHSGDATMRGLDDELANFGAWLKHACHKYKHVIYVPGNHDKCFGGPATDGTARAILAAMTDNRVIVLINEGVVIEGVRFFGSPITRPIGWPWYYYFDAAKAEAFWQAEAKTNPGGYDVLVTHDPPYRIGDKVANDWHHWPYVGCKGLREYVETTNPMLHVFGHIHEGYGVYEGARLGVMGRDEKLVRTVFVNASIRDEHYNKRNTPWLIEIGDVNGCLEVTDVQAVDRDYRAP